MLRWGSRILERTSPFGLFIGAAALALALPPVRRGLRALAVSAVAGAMSVNESLKSLTGNESRQAEPYQPNEDFSSDDYYESENSH